MRKGIVNYIDPALGVGSIIDENEQEILFHFNHPYEFLKTKTFVPFEIELDTNILVANGLRAMA